MGFAAHQHQKGYMWAKEKFLCSHVYEIMHIIIIRDTNVRHEWKCKENIGIRLITMFLCNERT